MLEWAPSEGIEPSSELMDIIKCNESIAILASAGAGKTELLAQKANYLFFTDTCTWPKRILSLTFKTEAQINIKERIKKRCGHKSTRFDSFTFHAFCKSIVDRFKNILPATVRPINNYDIVFQQHQANGTNKVLMDDLPVLALQILNTRDDIRAIFSNSYAYVFVDEFQDTTNQQYELLKLLFKNTNTKILAVGDINQSIMIWAGARQTIFTDFENDFSAQKKLLVRNYRASNEIQDVLGVILNFIENPNHSVGQTPTIPNNCSMHVFSNESQEASFIVDRINNAISNGLKANEICVLTKQHSTKYTEILREALTRAGINNLDMNDLQDVLKEPLGRLFTLYLKTLICPTPKTIAEINKIYLELNKVEAGEKKEEDLTISLINLISKKQELIKNTTTAHEILSHIQNFIHEIGIAKIKGRWKQYRSPEYYNRIWKTLESHLISMHDQANSLVDTVKLFSADNAVHLMNIHKCKGLEYDTVYFMGLEDQAFWSYNNQTFEDNCAIYVALSRSKNRIYITSSQYRSHRYTQYHDNRRSTYSAVRPVINLLKNKCNFSTTNHIS